MNSTELYNLWRSDVVDTVKPYLWSETEGWAYLDAAYKRFVRLTGGVADYTSSVTEVPVVAGEAFADIDVSILRVLTATRMSDSRDVQIINEQDLNAVRSRDYGQVKILAMDSTTGPVNYMVHGLERGKVRWIQIPEVNDTIKLSVRRMPLVGIGEPDMELVDIPEEDHHLHLLDYMKHLCYGKQDADTYNPKLSAECGQRFGAYCDEVRQAWDRYQHKPRAVRFSW